jgi:type I restriction enzyme S subunit
MLWFYRPEFNRYGWFISDSSVRASLEWDRFSDIKLPSLFLIILYLDKLLSVTFALDGINTLFTFIPSNFLTLSSEFLLSTSYIKLPIPDIKIQEAIVTIYHTLETRKRINEQLKASIKPLCPVLMRGVIEEIGIMPNLSIFFFCLLG